MTDLFTAQYRWYSPPGKHGSRVCQIKIGEVVIAEGVSQTRSEDPEIMRTGLADERAFSSAITNFGERLADALDAGEFHKSAWERAQ